MCIFRIPPTRSLIVGNIHVLFNPNRGDFKLGQMRLFLEKAHKLSQEWGCIPVVLAGDLNSMPQSALYQFLASSEVSLKFSCCVKLIGIVLLNILLQYCGTQLDVRLHDRRKISGQVEHQSQHRAYRYQNEDASRSRPLVHRWSNEELRLATGSDGVTHLQHCLKLCSAYYGIPGSCRTRDNYGEPLATSYHSKFMGTVDYIWHTEELVPVRVLETLPVDILRKTGGLPSELLMFAFLQKWGSDHLALVCELAFADDGSSS
ncbi:Carbon catabolite repressor protein 4-like 5 [Vitis vinifera]|uniref:Carbon catabolite repressor protein 4-like 5 n=1 Tax=Vitis vinifera TaxID=29760 RepID=A0A438JYZ6_VITVI|nr:Carbon catabolite repressor protein 4-like 5 [Vitis vinifera]